MNYDFAAKEKIPQIEYEIATFAAGSFWRVEAIFRQVRGVLATTVGFMGGMTEYPTYQQVSTGETGHAEVVQIIFDPQVVSYEKLLELFWEVHNPTKPADEGEKIQSQYRSVIFYHNENQHIIAVNSKRDQESSGRFKRDIITEILPATRFYKAKEYHQQYYEKMNSGGKLIR
ncbi:peptide-methionine (S)-S-oxide reductase MsrA [Methanolobus sp. ZRKC2]|uniref:peptide-methionine (S)-S-oxide reductase MsrA n=1 Tax=Methanolobus sp. ZRKC2 TaxID=3125783 RepID=UPI003252D8CD